MKLLSIAVLTFLSALTMPLQALAANVTVNVNTLSYSSTNVTTSAYVQLVASVPVGVQRIEICDSSGQILKIATGSAGNEVDIASTPLSACAVIPVTIQAGTRLSIKSLTASATTGFNVMSFLPGY